MPNLFPIFLDLQGKNCLVIGGGNVAFRKIRALLDAGASVKVVSPDVKPEIASLHKAGSIRWKEKKFEEGDLTEAFLVFSATSDKRVNARIAALCMERNIPVNVADDPANCSFHIPAVMRRGDLAVAISTGGNSPMLAAFIKHQLEAEYGKEYARYVKLLGELRKRIIKEIPDEKRRREIFKQLVHADLLQLIKEGRENEVKELVEQCIYSS